MSKVRIRNPAQDEPSEFAQGFYANAALHSYGTEIELDGRKLEDVRAIRLNIDSNEVVKATVEVIATNRLDVQINADVHVEALVIEPGLIIIEASDDGKTQRIRFIREAP